MRPTRPAEGATGALRSPQQDKRMGFRWPSVIDANRLELTGALKDPRAVMAVVGWCGPVNRTIVAGKTVMKDGHLLGIDEEPAAGMVSTHATGRQAPMVAFFEKKFQTSPW